ncbi:Hypothetical predicted protein [Lynx pardinus]|uniref:SPATA31-like domain-containing protein n=1 Tax=Lynx pardinus TaxID=191816 RepID=A0A485P7U1_LYNPA|nr:Hypothetical predicted protein [Lynx pardinus]
MAEIQFNLLGISIPVFLCGVGVLLLVLCYVKKNPCFGQCQERRKSWTLKGWKTCQSEAEEARKVISLLQSPLCQHHDTMHFRQLLCPDPFCEVCNSTTAEVNRLLFLEVLEDATLSVIPLAATAPVTDSSFSPSPAFTAVPPGDLKPAPLPEPSPPPLLFLT